ncbi:phospholipase [Duganella callida]|uniref:Phospholipase n=2 Tax=Duganella callida TaxID=2561932 RepID=A0A4Y9SYF3_9BURK|nr:phospholipase [Duganella callida]
MRNQRGQATHPITHNNRLTMFICGEKGFADIAKEIARARESIDLCCWGFDPGMELIRNKGATWPRGDTYGDLLIAAGRRGVKVRLLVWYDVLAVGANTMPGYSHGRLTWCMHQRDWATARQINAQHSRDTLADYVKRPFGLARMKQEHILLFASSAARIQPDEIPVLAREEYCNSWYNAAFDGHLENIEILTRLMKQTAATAGLDQHDTDLPRSRLEWLESEGLQKVATHHQKPILIDFAYNDGEKAVGYIMGLNSVTDYWDTEKHLLEDPQREQGGRREEKECLQGYEHDRGFQTFKPYRDYACRLDGGGALIAIHRNFVSAWHRAAVSGNGTEAAMARATREHLEDTIPKALTRPAQPGDCSVQIIRTQPEEQDSSIREVYFQATDIATMAAGYIYIENQYFQYEAWSRRLMESRARVVEGWKRGCAKAGKSMKDMPMLHVMIVIPVPERKQMVPRTYDALAVLGQQAGMVGQDRMIEAANKTASADQYDAMGTPISGEGPRDDVVVHANEISKPSTEFLETELRMKVSVAMLNTCAFVDGHNRYREIYIHSKLMLIDDTFMTLGSANLNTRSMAVDSEINLATVNPTLTDELRKNIWLSLSQKKMNRYLSLNDINFAHIAWCELMTENKNKKN